MHLISLLSWLLLLATTNAAVENQAPQSTVWTTVYSYTTVTSTSTIYASGAGNGTSPSYTAPASYSSAAPTVTSTLTGSSAISQYVPSSTYTGVGGSSSGSTQPVVTQPVETNPSTGALQAGAVSYREGGMAMAVLAGTVAMAIAAVL